MFLGGKSLKLFAFCDANYDNTGNCKSRLGMFIFMGYDLVASYNESVNDSVVSRSSAESEIRCLDRLIRVMVLIKAVVQWLGINVPDAIPIYEYRRG